MIQLNGSDLTLKQMKSIIYGKEFVAINPESMKKVRKSRNAVERIVSNGETVYGINTGFGKFSDVRIQDEDVDDLQLHLIRSHACGVGENFPEVVSKAMVVLRLNALLKGFSGVRPCVVERLRDMVNEDILPVIPSQGSLGASGDLAPLSHLALVLVGEGEVHNHGKIKPTQEAYQEFGYESLTLKAKEGLALINGTQAMTAMGVINYIEAERLIDQSDWVASMTLESLEGIIDAFHPAIHEARGYPEQVEVAERIRAITSDSKLVTHQGEKRVQDAYSLRCIPQVHGASRQSLAYVKEKLEIEMNAATDNPLIFDDGETVVSGGNFHGQPIALAMDFLKIAVAEMANISERRVERLVNPQLNDLPGFLSPDPGLQSGAMIMQYAAASLVSENKTLAHPASVDSIPSSANQEDHVSMGTIGARHAYQIIVNAQKVVSIELICAMQALEYRDTSLASSSVQKLFTKGREVVPSITEDRVFSKDIETLSTWLSDDQFDWTIQRKTISS
ncbi:histidine ammonia-lyase [Halobacillus shinanisalinarum]|uniref:Histidine ammonia-lyase n=1 Tax=Halobacillus shinanisalinarum TaxID=2932258 RepID=A0ABY4H238_9BACI|nr:histidine ammonia-lyase [Halobacillus shinanisalinarum]UOQ94493.1 histidine ammonia-lyase [Halobacillus shinanisalinarum]